MTLEELFAKIEEFGVDFDRLHGALDRPDNWGKMVHSFEYLTVLGVVEDAWKGHLESLSD